MLPIAPKALRFPASWFAADRLAALVSARCRSGCLRCRLRGVFSSSSASASTATAAALRESEASDCAGRATGTVSDSYKLAVCTDLDSDLVGIGTSWRVPVLAPTVHGGDKPGRGRLLRQTLTARLRPPPSWRRGSSRRARQHPTVQGGHLSLGVDAGYEYQTATVRLAGDSCRCSPTRRSTVTRTR